MLYAAFVITYKRPEIVKQTILQLFEQSIPPTKILIVDNDTEASAKILCNQINDQRIEYLAAGYNSGPSGGAYIGLKTLFSQGWEWVLWIDDDDPPSSPKQIETILKIIYNYPEPFRIGMLGASGVLYNHSQCLIQRIPDNQLNGIIQVDMVAGNQFPLVHRRVYEAGLLPDPNLFFGFEDLEYGLRIKQKGFEILVQGEEVERLRKHFNKFGKEKERGRKKNSNHLWREYYSVRTIAYILRNNKSFFAACRFTLRSLLKMVAGFKYGVRYGSRQSLYLFHGLLDGFRRKMGLIIVPNKKY
jgi:glycosyltransferase involved in cell wall biosynthesis